MRYHEHFVECDTVSPKNLIRPSPDQLVAKIQSTTQTTIRLLEAISAYIAFILHELHFHFIS